MDDLLEQYNRLKKQADQLQREADKAAGAHEELINQLKKEFGCKTLEEAKKLLTKLQREADQAEQEFAKQLEKYQKNWRDSQ